MNDSFTERMLERARERQKKLDEHFNIAGDNSKKPLKNSNQLLNKLENAKMTKSQPNLMSENQSKIQKSQNIASEPCLNKKTYYDSISNFKENLSDPNLHRISSKSLKTLVASENSPNNKSPTQKLNIQQENFNMEIKLTSSDNVRLQVEIEERDLSDESTENETQTNEKNENVDVVKRQNNVNEVFSNEKVDIDDNDTHEVPVIREDSKKRLQRLGQLYSGEDEALSSPIHRNEEKFIESEIEMEKKENIKSGLNPGLSRLKKLADEINHWEDDTTSSSSKIMKKDDTSKGPKKSWKPKAPAPKPPVTSTPPKKYQAPKPPTNVHAFTKVPSREASPEKDAQNIAPKSPLKNRDQKSTVGTNSETTTKQLKWDQAVIETLESQGFTRTNSNARLVYSYKESIPSENAKNEDCEIAKSSVLEEEDEEQQEKESSEDQTLISKIVSKVTSKFGSNETLTEKPIFKPKSPTKNEISSRVAMFEEKVNQNSPSKKDPALLSVSERKALFEKNKGTALIPKAAFGMAIPKKKLDEKLELQEKNEITTGKAPSSPIKTRTVTAGSTQQKTESPIKSGLTKSGVDSPASQGIKQSGGIASRMKALLDKKTTIAESQIENNLKEQRQKELDLLLNRYNKQKEVDDESDDEIVPIETKSESESESEAEEDLENVSETTKMIATKSKMTKIKTFKGSSNSLAGAICPPPPPPMPPVQKAAKRTSKGESGRVREVLEEVKRIKVSPPKPGRMYPNLSDIEASTEAQTSPDSSFESNDSYEDSEGPNTSFGRDILQTICKNQTPLKKQSLSDDSEDNVSDVLEELNEYLTEDWENQSGPTPPKHGKPTPQKSCTSSDSFNYKNFTPIKKSPTKKIMSPLRETLTDSEPSRCVPTIIVDGKNELPLTHSVSFYRKQQAQSSNTPVRKIQRQPAIEDIEEIESPMKDKVSNEKVEVDKKIQQLLEDVTKQQTVISQASQALNLCVSTIEFSGSSEQVEAERLLLVATQRRQAAMHEIQRLRVEGTLQPGGTNCLDKGTLTISDITLPLKKEYARALSSAGGLGHHVVCLLRYAEHVMPTRLASTQASPRDNLEMNLRIPGSVKLDNVYSNFTARLEVYTLQAQEEILPHEVKYHIAAKKGSKLTPKKLKTDSKLVMPAVQSPAGPQAVRSPSFSLVGYTVFSLQGISRTQWTLNNTPSMSPLDGTILMRIKCELEILVEHRGFLSMFDDVSGFGAWHRRWCLLKGNTISYWKYPEDERKKAPIDSIHLQICSTKNVGPVSREICARPNTFLLETVRPARANDIDSLVTVCQGDKTIIRHLLSADTKEERSEWCEQLNKALRGIRLISHK